MNLFIRMCFWMDIKGLIHTHHLHDGERKVLIPLFNNNGYNSAVPFLLIGFYKSTILIYGTYFIFFFFYNFTS